MYADQIELLTEAAETHALISASRALRCIVNYVRSVVPQDSHSFVFRKVRCPRCGHSAMASKVKVRALWRCPCAVRLAELPGPAVLLQRRATVRDGSSPRRLGLLLLSCAQEEVELELSAGQAQWLQAIAEEYKLADISKAVRVMLNFVRQRCEAGHEREVFGLF